MEEDVTRVREETTEYGEEKRGFDVKMGDTSENKESDDARIKEQDKMVSNETRGDCVQKDECYAAGEKEEVDTEVENQVNISGLNDGVIVFEDDNDDVSSENEEQTTFKSSFPQFDFPSSPPHPDTQEAPSSHPTSFTPDSIPESHTTDTNSEIQSSGMDEEEDEDEDLSMMFVYPPNLSRLATLGSIYSHLSSPQSCGDSCSDRESDGCVSPTNDEVKESSVQGNTDAKDETERQGNEEMNSICTDRQDGETQRTSNGPHTKTGMGSVKMKKVPPPKPPRKRLPPTRRNETAKRVSREDPIRYSEITERPKRSTSMGNICESSCNVEAVGDERCSMYTRSPQDKVVERMHSAGAGQDGKEHRRDRCKSGGSKIKDAAKIMTSIMSKKPLFAPKLLGRKEAIRSRNLALKKVLTKEMESPPTSPAPLQPQLPQPQNCMLDVSLTSNVPKKPPRKDLEELSKDSLDKAQGKCSAHGALLHFYCVKCRVVVCRDCTVVAHSHSENHKVLDTLDSLAMLRLEAGEMLRHYTILDTVHASLTEIYTKFKVQHRDADISAIGERLEEGKYLSAVVKEAEQMIKTCTNLEQIRESVKQWEARQEDWSDLVYLASRCSLLADMHMPYDTVLLRMGNWVMPTPWIQLSHLLQPYLRASPAPPQTAPSHQSREEQPTSSTDRRKGMGFSPLATRRNGNLYGVGGTNTGGTDRPFPYNAKQVVLSNLVPYIILNPDIRYFMHIGGPRDVDLTLVVVPTEDHAHLCLKQSRNNATKSPEALRHNSHHRYMDAITLMEQQMTSGSCKTRITASSLPAGSSATPTLIKVSFPDVKIVSDGRGLPMTKDGVKRGDVIVEYGQGGKPTLTAVVRDIKDYSALFFGHVTWGMDGLMFLVGTEDTRKAETSGFRAKIKATVKREEEALYDVMFGMDL